MSIYATIRSHEVKAADVKRDYLREHGWQYTCQTPGAYWLWRRSFADVNERRLAEHKAFCERIKQEREHYPYPDEMLVDTDWAVKMTWLEIDPRRRELEDETD